MMSLTIDFESFPLGSKELLSVTSFRHFLALVVDQLFFQMEVLGPLSVVLENRANKGVNTCASIFPFLKKKFRIPNPTEDFNKKLEFLPARRLNSSSAF